ncbi:BCL2 associated agonist of cell death b [Hoplias malabaricus]|uniref:BCL2 associated agonist of cell death b n=1 Tax=Hoplias malabaricus TaxID=27720 RepID=UPI003461E8C8
MDHKFTISDESDSSDGLEEAEQPSVRQRAKPQPSGKQHLVPGGLKEPKQRKYSMNEEALQESGVGRQEAGAGDGDSFRRRCTSAPPALWAAKKYGRQLRKMSDEFDTLLDKGMKMKRVNSASTTSQMHTSPSWLAFLWSHKESDSEASSSLKAPDTRPSE